MSLKICANPLEATKLLPKNSTLTCWAYTCAVQSRQSSVKIFFIVHQKTGKDALRMGGIQALLHETGILADEAEREDYFAAFRA